MHINIDWPDREINSPQVSGDAFLCTLNKDESLYCFERKM